MFTLFVSLVFGWLFFKSVGLAFHLTKHIMANCERLPACAAGNKEE